VILLRWTLVIFFWDEHGFILKHSISINVHKMKFKIMTPRQVSKNQHRLKEKIEKERIQEEKLKNAEGREN